MLILTTLSEEETCPEKEECLAQGECEEFQNKKRKLRTISDKSSQEYSSILKGLRDKVYTDEYSVVLHLTQIPEQY